MRYYIEHDPLLRPGALCIPPHLHGAIFEPSIDADIPPSFLARPTAVSSASGKVAPSTSTISIAQLPSTVTSSSMCSDRPTPSERRHLAPAGSASAGSPRTKPKTPLVPRSAYAEHVSVRLPPFDARNRLEPRSAYAERTPVRIPPYDERVHGRLEPRSAYAEHVAVELPAYEERERGSVVQEDEKTWLANGGLPIPTTCAAKAKKTWNARRALIVVLAFISLPLAWLVIGDQVMFLNSLAEFHLDVTDVDALTLDTTLPPSLPQPSIEVPPLDYEWWRRCTDLLVEPKNTHADRLDKLASALDGAAWVGEPGPSVEYFLGAFGKGIWKPSERPFLVAVKGDKIMLLTPAFEESRARLIALPGDVKARVTWVAWAESESPYAALVSALGKVDIVVDGAARTFITEGIRHAQAQNGFVNDSRVEAAVASIRERKDEREIGLLRCANEATLHAIRKTRARMYIGIHESKTRAILYEEMKHLGLTDYSALVLFGPNAALPHGSGTDRVLAIDEFALIDAGGRWGGYLADITRTFFLPDSTIPEKHQWVWEIVRAAQRAPANLLRLIDTNEEAYFSWLDDRARETVKKGMAALGVPPQKGHKPDYTVLTHRTGHGIGLEGHEAPYVVQGPLGERRVRTGHTFTLEPGVYVPKDSELGDESIRGLGVRMEDTVVVVEREGRLAVEWLTGPVEHWGDV